MKIITSLLLSLFSACTHVPVATIAEESDLRNMLVPGFALSTVPESQKKEFYLVLAVFAGTRKATEFVREVNFNASMDQASVAFSFEAGLHGGGYAFFKKKDGQWVVDSTYYSV